VAEGDIGLGTCGAIRPMNHHLEMKNPNNGTRFNAGDFACSYCLDRSDWPSYLNSGSCSYPGYRQDWCRFRAFLKSPNWSYLSLRSCRNCYCPSHHRCLR
jgi:hypothetical protein